MTNEKEGGGEAGESELAFSCEDDFLGKGRGL